MDVLTALTILLCVIILSLAFAYVDLHLKVSNVIDLKVKADKHNRTESPQEDSGEETDRQRGEIDG